LISALPKPFVILAVEMFLLWMNRLTHEGERKVPFESFPECSTSNCTPIFLCSRCLSPPVLSFVRGFSASAADSRVIPAPLQSLSPKQISFGKAFPVNEDIVSAMAFLLVKPPLVIVNKEKTSIPSYTGISKSIARRSKVGD